MNASPQLDDTDGSAPAHIQLMAGFISLALRERLGNSLPAHRAVEAAFVACLTCMDEVEAQMLAAAYARSLEDSIGPHGADLALNELETRISRSSRIDAPALPCGMHPAMLCSLGHQSLCERDCPQRKSRAGSRG